MSAWGQRNAAQRNMLTVMGCFEEQRKTIISCCLWVCVLTHFVCVLAERLLLGQWVASWLVLERGWWRTIKLMEVWSTSVQNLKSEYTSEAPDSPVQLLVPAYNEMWHRWNRHLRFLFSDGFYSEEEPLFRAIREGDSSKVKALAMSPGTNLMLPSKPGWLAVHQAAWFGQEACLRMLLKGRHAHPPSPHKD